MRTLLIGAALLAAAPALGPALAQDAERGRTLFQRQCGTCHQVAAPRNAVGPYLVGVVGRPAASAVGFNYSAAMKDSGITWNTDELESFLADPPGKVRGTRKMVRVPNAADRADIVAFLGTLAGN